MNDQPLLSDSDRSAFLKPFWSRTIGPPWLVSLLLMILLGAVRYIAIFSAYPAQALFFLQYAAMWIAPFALLTTNGRYQIGLRERGATLKSMGLGCLAGSLYGLAVFVLGTSLYGYSQDNWCISLREYLRLTELRGVLHPAAVFGIFAVPAILFAPIADEVLFRGFIQTTFERRWNVVVATTVNCVAYGLTYLYFHAFWQDAAGIHYRNVSGTLTFVLFVGIALVFTLCRHLSGSLWTAVAAHAGFNLTMLGAAIFYYMR
jgi:membrane protease YdiL (CAAX protease family)